MAWRWPTPDQFSDALQDKGKTRYTVFWSYYDDSTDEEVRKGWTYIDIALGGYSVTPEKKYAWKLLVSITDNYFKFHERLPKLSNIAIDAVVIGWPQVLFGGSDD